MRLNYLVEITNDKNHHREFITVWALDEGHARVIGDLACNAMYEDYHEAPTYSVALVTALD